MRVRSHYGSIIVALVNIVKTNDVFARLVSYSYIYFQRVLLCLFSFIWRNRIYNKTHGKGSDLSLIDVNYYLYLSSCGKIFTLRCLALPPGARLKYPIEITIYIYIYMYDFFLKPTKFYDVTCRSRSF